MLLNPKNNLIIAWLQILNMFKVTELYCQNDLDEYIDLSWSSDSSKVRKLAMEQSLNKKTDACVKGDLCQNISTELKLKKLCFVLFSSSLLSAFGT